MKALLLITLLFIYSLHADDVALKNGRETSELLKTSSFSWTAVHGNVDMKHFEVEVYKTPECSRLDMFFVFEEERQHMSTTYMFKDHWFVEENGSKGKFRPYEAPFSLPTAYYYLMKSKVQVVNEGNIQFLGEFKGKNKGICRYSRAMTVEEKEAIRNRVDFLKEKLIPAAQTRAEEQFYLRQAKKLLDYAKDGKINLVDESSGIVTQLDTPDGLVSIKNFQLVTIPDSSHVTPEGDYKDFTEIPDKEHIIFLGHNENWQPGMANFQTDGRIINLKTESMRRIPFRGAVSTPMCFDETSNLVYVTGIPLGTNDIRPFVIDLNTGSQTSLGGSYFYKGQTSSLALSNDKTLIAALHILNPEVSPKKDLVIIDSKQKKILRYPLENLTGKVIWHPDNKSLFLMSFDEKSGKNIVSHFIPGVKSTEILEALDVIYLKDQKRLMYLDPKDQKWKTCNLEGKNSITVSDGLQKLQYPAYGNSSDEILMIQEDENKMPVPVLYDFLSKSALKITSKKGLWLTPVWK